MLLKAVWITLFLGFIGAWCLMVPTIPSYAGTGIDEIFRMMFRAGAAANRWIDVDQLIVCIRLYLSILGLFWFWKLYIYILNKNT